MLNTPIKPMLMHKSDAVPTDNYIHQLKWDGFRCLMHYDGQQFRLFTRHQNECTLQFPEMKNVQVDVKNVILDGEMIVLNSDNVPCFESVMSRFQASNELSIRRGVKTMPAHFVAYDILYLNNKDITKLPLKERLDILYDTVHLSKEISASESYQNGDELFHLISQMGLEGIVSKRKDSLYHLDTRSSHWLKVKNYQYETVSISALRKKDFGWSLLHKEKHVGVMELVPSNERKAFWEISKQLQIGEDKNWIYLDPIVKCKVKFQSYTKNGLMRSPSFIEFIY
ncbi:RNA ligase family protein [Ammoniphilus sp. CFH 90114]|uniref:ATP-dependent DNA ligase n=1 Tax=Ammoniphilus sp. CFH 90114 TaxID=2493665 RepID=UPI00100F80EB|nr:RNA ligase family protein [Ammoniphilus sp. CFH 90114]RXT03581.1 DNA polymerase LigD [Ammoniphilus sp. CFH 90114]